MPRSVTVGFLVAVSATIFVSTASNAEEKKPSLENCSNLMGEAGDGPLAFKCIGFLAKELAKTKIPENAVLLSTSRCEDFGWERVKESYGRFAVGAGVDLTGLESDADIRFNLLPNGDRARDELKAYTGHPYEVLEIGGEEHVYLTNDQVQEHRHKVGWASGGDLHTITFNKKKADEPPNDDAQYWVDFDSEGGQAGRNFMTDYIGKSLPHNNMPPFFALYFCQQKSSIQSD